MPLTSEAIIGMVVVAILLFCSAMISGSEVAYFSLGPLHIAELRNIRPARKPWCFTCWKSPKGFWLTF